MKYKIAWLIVLFLSGFIFCWFGLKTFNQINYFLTLESSSKAHIDKIQIHETKKEKFEVLVSYNYKIGDNFFFKTEALKNVFMNNQAANGYISKMPKDILIFYNFKNPSIAAMTKTFPIKNLVYSIITLIIFGYFVVMKYYVFSFQKTG